jgi:predicted PurR-regulated permease PerM
MDVPGDQPRDVPDQPREDPEPDATDPSVERPSTSGESPESIPASIPPGTAPPGVPPGSVPFGIPVGEGDEMGRRYGLPGMPVNRAHPFYIGFMGAFGVLIAYWLIGLVGRLSSVLTLVAVALFLALGLDRTVQFVQRHLKVGRGWSIAIVFSVVVAIVAGFIASVAPTLVAQGSQLSASLPDILDSFQESSFVQQLDRKYEIIAKLNEQLQQRLTEGDTAIQLFGGVFGAGKAVVSGAFSIFTVLVLMLYFLVSMHSMTEAAYRLVPASRRARVRLLGDEIIRRIGSYIAGQISIATLNGFFTYILLSVLGMDFRLILAITVGLFGLIPLVGATLGAIVVILVALFHSWQYALIVFIYYVIYQQVENYIIAPRIMSRTVSVPGAVTVVAALAGGTLLGVVGALLAIPVAAGVLLILQEVVIPRQARS